MYISKVSGYTHIYTHISRFFTKPVQRSSRMHFIHQSTAVESTSINKFNPNQRHKHSVAYDIVMQNFLKLHSPILLIEKEIASNFFYLLYNNREQMALKD